MLKGDFELLEIKPDKMPVAIYERMDRFEAVEVQLKQGDQVYLFSDGYADQFGVITSYSIHYTKLYECNDWMLFVSKLTNTCSSSLAEPITHELGLRSMVIDKPGRLI